MSAPQKTQPGTFEAGKAKAYELGLFIQQSGVFGGWAAYDMHNGYPASLPHGLPENAFLYPPDESLPELLRFDWSWAEERHTVFAAVEEGSLRPDEVWARWPADRLRVIEVCPDPKLFTKRFIAHTLAMLDTYAAAGLWALYEAGAKPKRLADQVIEVWTCMEYPQQALDEEQWLELFAIAGFRRDGKPAEKPTTPVRLYRGAPESRKARWAWTADWETAHKFAHKGNTPRYNPLKEKPVMDAELKALLATAPRITQEQVYGLRAWTADWETAHEFAHKGKGYRQKDGKVWTVLAQPHQLLAYTDGRGEDEWVANVEDHQVELDTRECDC